MLPQVHPVQHFVDDFLALPAVGDALEKGDLVEHLFRIHAWIYTEILGKIAQHPAHFVLGAKHVDTVKADRPGIRFLQRGDGAHQRRFAGAVWTQQPVKSHRNGEVDIIEGPYAALINLVQARNLKFHENSALPARVQRESKNTRRSPGTTWHLVRRHLESV